MFNSAFRKRFRSPYDSSPSSTLLVRKRYRGTSELILDTNSDEDELGDEDTDKDERDESLDANDEREGLDDEDRGLDDEGRSIDEEGLELEGERRRLYPRVNKEQHACLVDTELEPKEAPSEAEELHSLGSRVPLRGKEFMAVEPSETKIDSSQSSGSSDSTAPLSPDHPLTRTSPTPTPTHASFHRRTAHMILRVLPTMSPDLSLV
nr:hypothetical protein [Tanacetum cinerariifolium]